MDWDKEQILAAGCQLKTYVHIRTLRKKRAQANVVLPSVDSERERRKAQKHGNTTSYSASVSFTKYAVAIGNGCISNKS